MGAMRALKTFFPDRAGEGSFWNDRVEAYRIVLQGITRDEMKAVIDHMSKTRNTTFWPSSGDLFAAWNQLRNASYPGTDPAAERERQEREAERLNLEAFDREYDQLIRPLSPKKQAFIREHPMGTWGKMGAVLVFRNLESGMDPRSAEWRELG